MTDERSQFLESRRYALGATDMSVVMGCGRRDKQGRPYKTQHQLQMEKLGQLPLNRKTSKAAKLGLGLESGVLDLAEEELGFRLRRKVRLRWPDKSIPIVANCDALTVSTNEPVDAKTSGIFNPHHVSEAWGDRMTDVVPREILIQIQCQIACAESDLGYVAAVLAKRGFVPYVIKRYPRVIDAIAERAAEWWKRHVIEREPCPDIEETRIDVWRQVNRIPESVGRVSPETHAKLEQVKKERKALKQRYEAAQRAVLREIGTDEAARVEGEGNIYTCFETTRSEHVVNESTFRALRWVKNKSHL